MTPIELATLIGNVLTQLDSKLSDPAFPMSDPNWQTLYALRKHLDDLQRSLIQASIADGNSSYTGLTQQITVANTDLQTVIKDNAKVTAVIGDLSKIASVVDQILKLKP
jgi:hypothetical protein